MFHRESYNQTQPATQSEDKLKNLVIIVYALQLMSAFTLGLFALIPLFISYVARMRAPSAWLDSHFRWQIQTFWFSTIFFVLSWAFSFIPLIGWFFSFFSLLIGISIIGYRSFKGLKKHSARKPIQSLPE